MVQDDLDNLEQDQIEDIESDVDLEDFVDDSEDVLETIDDEDDDGLSDFELPDEEEELVEEEIEQ